MELPTSTGCRVRTSSWTSTRRGCRRRVRLPQAHRLSLLAPAEPVEATELGLYVVALVERQPATQPPGLAGLPLVSHKSRRTPSFLGATWAPKETPLGSRRVMASPPAAWRTHSGGSRSICCFVQTVGTCVWAR